MMSNIHNKKVHYSYHQQGFSLLELLVASIVGLVVLMAAGATYLSTFKLKQQVQTQVTYEQDVRMVSNLLRRDARQVADYNCLAGPTAQQLNNIDGLSGAFVDNNNEQSMSTTLPTTFSAKNPGLIVDSNSNPLIMLSASESLANKILANGDRRCGQAITSIQPNDGTLQSITYVVATASSSNNKGLYRVPYLTGNVPQSGPQLLIDNVISMKNEFQYDDFKPQNCPTPPEDENASLVWHDPKLTPDLDKGATPIAKLDLKFKQPPVLITTTLVTCPNGIDTDGKSCAKGKQPVTYIIKSMVRQGEVCAKEEMNT